MPILIRSAEFYLAPAQRLTTLLPSFVEVVEGRRTELQYKQRAEAMLDDFDRRPPEDPFPSEAKFFEEAGALLVHAAGKHPDNLMKLLDARIWSRNTWLGFVRTAESRLKVYNHAVRIFKPELVSLAKTLANGSHLVMRSSSLLTSRRTPTGKIDRPMIALIKWLSSVPLKEDTHSGTDRETERSRSRSKKSKDLEVIVHDALHYAAKIKLGVQGSATKFMQAKDIRQSFNLTEREMNQVRKQLERWGRTNEDSMRVFDTAGGKTRYEYPSNIVAYFVDKCRLRSTS